MNGRRLLGVQPTLPTTWVNERGGEVLDERGAAATRREDDMFRRITQEMTLSDVLHELRNQRDLVAFRRGRSHEVWERHVEPALHPCRDGLGFEAPRAGDAVPRLHERVGDPEP